MIAKGNLHGDGAKLAAYLLTAEEGQIAQLVETRGLEGFGSDPVAAFDALQQIADAHTRSTQPFFHVQTRNAPGEHLTDAQWREVADREEKRLGFSGQPRIVSYHIDEATGEKHLHVAWFRVDLENMRAIDPGMFKNHLKQLARKLEREFALREVSNTRQPGDRARAADRNEVEESRRLGTDLRAIRNSILGSYEQSDSGKAFKAALEAKGLMLANGDRRDCFVVVDREGGHHALNKKLTGQTLAATRERLADLDRSQLPSVEQAQAMQAERSRAHEAIAIKAEPIQAAEVARQQSEPDMPAARGRYASLDPHETPPAPGSEHELSRNAAEILNRSAETPAIEAENITHYDRDAEEAAWLDAVANAAIAKDEALRAADAHKPVKPDMPAARGAYASLEPHETTATPKLMRELTGTAAQIRAAWEMKGTASEFESQLAAHGISLAQVSSEEAYASERRADFAKEAGNFAARLREGEIVAVDGYGAVYRLNERTTGDQRAEIESRLAHIDRSALMNVADTADSMRAASWAAYRSEHQAKREEARPASAIETTVADALKATMTGMEFAIALEEKGLTIARVTSADVRALEALRAEDVSATAIGEISGRRFAYLLEGDFAAVTRQGNVFQLSPRKLDLEEIEQRLADVEIRMPSVVEARARFEIEGECKAEERAQRETDFIAARIEQADAFAGRRELRQAARAAERDVHETFSASAAAIDTGIHATGKLLGGASKIVGSLFGAISNLFGDTEPKLTRQQVHDKAQAAGNIETQHAHDVAAAMRANDAEHDDRQHAQKTAQQEQDLSLSIRFGTPPTREANIGRERDNDYERERER
jgi:Relaxase/Mobilisation nuclease domain